MTTYLLAGGGTAGHVNPLLAVADGLTARSTDDEVLVLGTAQGLESRLVPERGYELLIVDKVPFPRRPNADALRFPKRFSRAVKTVRAYIRERGVDVVLGVGGYAAAPAYVAAKKEGIPTVVHEANARPGLANVLGARSAAAVGVAFDGTPLKRGEVVGMPLRPEIVGLDRSARRAEAAEYFGVDEEKPVLLAFGGSLGARRINEALAESWRDIVDAGWQLVHITGEKAEVADPGVQGYAVRRYVDRMDLAFSLADLIVSRSGASTVSEIAALGIPALYVPYAVGNGEQRLNADASVRAGAARVIDDAAFTADRVRSEIIPLLADRDEVARMAAAASGAGTRRGTENVIAHLDRALGGTR
ncbi:UDP-N-acetylglucosamine--N-acetylmuramyl-(pentapeptide) pyrophosphoryl-undecaprenol N-acetylglucosamine transferase [Microbacterium amylolyticum]|uniref:UDP-N-acetylglucosamine--N-acetylmuramyl-(pentapeptide) pyrophosphoryl-undecaprenol N-acetylglucosamine transferase n=1 Tax=Microbacterium amylolyticum TaxID=936337 RepID=A0ABS4ZG27_9MICO|nr:UDP-N-acetylglucosamine--N-acetylmuramyl-(pentapeptide) pyrophosphoryl-undecaprenol N-acetylglucosamine transferase [Microbacterium amylolyticum]MBP2435993.1 UDP-N-acetylglucosamine--N-acetylmuramyl-(pentapeptide) pyrophosphoryl-undecaprenol N-acetylglucosamine transferase [Microbacterium amylolyticum]